MGAPIDFDEATKKWLEKKPSRFAIEMDGIVKYGSDGAQSIGKEDFVNLLDALIKRFGAKVFGIEHYCEGLPPEEVAKRLEVETEVLRRVELQKGYKPYHYHLVLMCGQNVRIGTLAKEICEFFGVPFKVFVGDKLSVNPFLHIQEAISDNCIGLIRYLTHIDEKDKKLFLVDDVITNDRGYLRFCMECKGGFVSADALMRVLKLCDGRKSKVMDMVGLRFYNRYRWTIIDLIKEGMWHEVRMDEV